MKYIIFVCIIIIVFNCLYCNGKNIPQNVFEPGIFLPSLQNKSFPKGWSSFYKKHITLRPNKSKEYILRIENNSPSSTTLLKSTLKLKKGWKVLILETMVKVDKIIPGKLSWHNARINLIFRNESGKHVGGWRCPQFKKVQKWKTVRFLFSIPEGAKTLEIAPCVAKSRGIMELSSISVFGYKNKANIKWKLANAKLPKGEKLFWSQTPCKKISTFRKKINLNGLWRFMPVLNGLEEPPKLGWGYIRVPGSWHSAWGWNKSIEGVIAKGKGSMWHSPLNKVTVAWYEREIIIPKDWAEKEILLNLERVSTDALIFINGKKCASIKWPGGSVSISDKVPCGKKFLLRILVSANNSARMITTFADANSFSRKKANLNTHGITGDIWLAARPRGAHIDSLFIKSSVRKATLSVNIELLGLTQKGKLYFNVKIKDTQGNTVKKFSKEAEVNSLPKQTIELSWKWGKPKLWDFQTPNLYKMFISVKGKKIEDEYSQCFGFREFRISGKNFLLNEKPFRFRPTLAFRERFLGGNREAIKNMIDGYMDANFNIMQLWPFDYYRRGVLNFHKEWSNIAAQKGFPLIYPLPAINAFMGKWNKKSVRTIWKNRVIKEWKKIRNNPAVLVLITTPNRFGHKDDQNPLRLGNSWTTSGDEKWKTRASAGMDAIKIIKELDQTRPVTTHHGASIGDFHTCNNYMNMIPLQEREDWLSFWATSGNMPYMAIEFGTPWLTTMLRGRMYARNTLFTEPLLTEFCAIYFGKKAYAMESQKYREAIKTMFVEKQKYRNWQIRPEGQTLFYSKSFMDLQSLFIKNIWRAWRTWGITGGMIPWDNGFGWNFHSVGEITKMPPFKPGATGSYSSSFDSANYYNINGGWKINKAGKTLKKANKPFVAWIGGQRENFTEKSHNFYSGTTVEKTIILIGDFRKSKKYVVKCEVFCGKKKILHKKFNGDILPGKNIFIPISFLVPTVSNKVKSTIKVFAESGNCKTEDVFTFRVYPVIKKQKSLQKICYIFDPIGNTEILINKLGWKTKPWKGEIENGKLLVIGQNAMCHKKNLPGSIKNFVKSGGRAVIFAQQPEFYSKMIGFRTALHVSRRVFKIDKTHAILDDLDDTDLKNWNGSGSLVSDYSNVSFKWEKDLTHGWHWGNKASVASVVIEKPHFSGLIPILECEFDLAYSPLMELNYGDGILIFTCIDFEKRGAIEPAADNLLKGIINYATALSTPRKRLKTYYAGNKSGENVLKQFGVRFKTSSEIPNIIPSLLILGDEAKFDNDMLIKYVEKGGRILALPNKKCTPLGFLSKEITLKKINHVPDWQVCRGMSISDLHIRADIKAKLLFKGPGEIAANGLLGRFKKGKGEAILIQILPDGLNYKVKTYLRYSAWRITHLFSLLLSNMGASFESDENCFNIPPSLTPVDGKWLVKIEKRIEAKRQISIDTGNKGEEKGWAKSSFNSKEWENMELPVKWESLGGKWTNLNGAVWFRKKINIPDAWKGQDVILSLGAVDDFDTTYFNGEIVGKTGRETERFWKKNRVYSIPGRLVKPGENILTIRVFDHYGEGGFAGPSSLMFIKLKNAKKAPHSIPEFYHTDYKTDHKLGDDPYRYYRW